MEMGDIYVCSHTVVKIIETSCYTLLFLEERNIAQS